MDRNSIIGIILIAAIFVVWGIVNQPSEEEKQKLIAERDSIAAVRKQEAAERELKIQETKTTEVKTKTTPDSLALAHKALKYGAFGKSVYGENKLYTLENDLIKLTVSAKGGRPYSVELKKYRTYDSLPLVLFDGDSTQFNLQFYTDNRTHSVFTQDLIFKGDSLSPNIVVSTAPGKLVLRSAGEQGKAIEYTYQLAPDSYVVDMDINMVGLEQEMSGATVNLNWGFYSPMQEKGWKNEAMYSTIYYKHNQDEVDFFSSRSTKDYVEKEVPTKIDWVAYKDQFFSSVLMGEKPFESASMEIYRQPENSKYIKQYISNITIAPQPNQPIALNFYFGPNDFKYLKKNFKEHDLHAIVAVGRGIIKIINQGVIINLFNFLNKYISNYGIIILLMTVIIKAFLLPLTYRSYKSQAKMRVVKPMVDEATKKIPKEDAMKRQQVTMDIYRKVGVSPMGGCLPMVLQMPILFAMFRFFPGSIELRQQSFLWANDLSTYDDLIHWSANVPLLGHHLSLFTVLMTVTTLISMRTSSSAQMSDQSMPGMKTMMYIMPVTFLFVLNNYSAALTYYYFLANMITFGQNFLFKRMIDEKEVLKQLEAKKAKPRKKSKWQQRIEEMQKSQQTGKRKK